MIGMHLSFFLMNLEHETLQAYKNRCQENHVLL